METKGLPINIAMSRQLRAERNAHPELTIKQIAKRTGLSVGTLNRVFAKDEAAIRDINVSVIALLASVFGLTAQELVEAAVRRAERMSAVSEAGSTPDALAQQRAKKDAAAVDRDTEPDARTIDEYEGDRAADAERLGDAEDGEPESDEPS